MLQENEIRPKNLMSGLEHEIELDRQWLVNRMNEFVKSSCPACGSNGNQAFFKKGLTYQKCPACHTVFMSPRPTETILHEFYSLSRTYAYWNKNIFPASEDARLKKIFSPRVDRVVDFCRRYLVRRDSMLEVGAGFGTFCSEMSRREVFSDVFALEMTPDLAETCRARGLKVIEKPVEKLTEYENAIDVIAAFETIEHLGDAKKFLISCRKMLVKGGLLILTCPNIQGFDVVALGIESDTIDHEHLNYFNPKSIKILIESSGFETLEISTPGELDFDIVRNKFLDGKIDLKQSPWIELIVHDRFEDVSRPFQNFLKENLLSTHMWTVARAV